MQTEEVSLKFVDGKNKVDAIFCENLDNIQTLFWPSIDKQQVMWCKRITEIAFHSWKYFYTYV